MLSNNLNLSDDWLFFLNEELEKQYFTSLWDFLEIEYKNEVCFPSKNKIFSAFNYCSIKDLKVVIIGQDPYHGYGQANGLCFSVTKNHSHPPSLINIFKELKSDINKSYPESGDLTSWAKQGVFLLNSTLTVRENNPGSHQGKGWETFTDNVIKKISNKKQNIVFLLWGSYAKKKIKLINSSKHKILTSGHPSPLSANRGYWFGNKHFSKTNEYLIQNDLRPIEWRNDF